MATKIVRLLAILTALSFGCVFSTTSGFDAEVKHSGFDNAKMVTVVAHGCDCSRCTVLDVNKTCFCTGLGAQWSEAHPSDAVLIVRTFAAAGEIVGAELMIDGQKYVLTPTHPIADLNSMTTAGDSQKAFSIPLDLIREVASSRRTWVRVHTATTILEDAVIDGETDSKAYHALKRFLAAVGETSKTSRRAKSLARQPDQKQAEHQEAAHPQQESNPTNETSRPGQTEGPFE